MSELIRAYIEHREVERATGTGMRATNNSIRIGDRVKLNPAGMTEVGKKELHRWMDKVGEVNAIMPREKYTIGVDFAKDDPTWLIWVAERELVKVEAS